MSRYQTFGQRQEVYVPSKRAHLRLKRSRLYKQTYTHTRTPKDSSSQHMICRNCLRVASRAQPAISTTPAARTHRFLTTSSRLSNAAAPSTPPNASSASSPAAAKSTPAGAEQQAAKKKATPLVKSSIPAGVPLKGLNFLKNAQDPVALPDDEYPEWLWTVLDRQEKKDEAGTGDLFCTLIPCLFYWFIHVQGRSSMLLGD